jgi:hypothetical protein
MQSGVRSIKPAVVDNFFLAFFQLVYTMLTTYSRLFTPPLPHLFLNLGRVSSILALGSLLPLLLRILITTRRTQSTDLIPRMKHLPTHRPLLTLFNAYTWIKPAMSAAEEVRVCLDAHCIRDVCQRIFDEKYFDMSEQARWLRSPA